MQNKDIKEFFLKIIILEKNTSAGVAAIRTLKEVIHQSKSETVQEIEATLKNAINVMESTHVPVAGIKSGSELFLRFITLGGIDAVGSFTECKQLMLERGELFLKQANEARGKIVKFASKFITKSSKILTHSRSRVVLQVFKEAYAKNKGFEVFVTMSAPDNSGYSFYQELRSIGITVTLILDSAIGYIMDQIDFVMIGAEGVLESGGIVNKIGTCSLAICAKEMKKPFYVLSESFKFLRVFPFNQKDLPNEYKYSDKKAPNRRAIHPSVDYTPPSYITLLFTDKGILTPSAVSDFLINLYL